MVILVVRFYQLLFILLLLCTICLNGCWNSKELSDIALVTGMGFDKEKVDSQEVIMTSQVIIPKEHPSMAGAAESTSEENKPYTNLTQKGVSIFDAVRKTNAFYSNKQFWGHLKTVIIGKNAAKAGINSYMDFLIRDHELRRQAYILISEKKPETILGLMADMELIPSITMQGLVESARFSGFASSVNLQNFLSRLMSESTAPIAALVKTKKHEANALPHVYGTAIFSKGKQARLIGKLNEHETRGFLFVIGQVKSGIVSFKYPPTEEIVSIELLSNKVAIKPLFKKKGPVFQVTLKIIGALGEQLYLGDLTSFQAKAKLNRLFAQEVRREVMKSMAKAKKLKADIYGFGEIIYQKNPHYWQKIKKNWPEIFAKSEFDLKIKTRIKYSGLIIKSPISN